MNSQSFVTVFAGSIANQTEQLCNARDLHAALKVGRDFSTWIKDRLAEYGFEENQDFITVIPQNNKSGRGGDRRSKDYHLTLDTAKELAMVEKTEVGRQIRRYFIQCEKELRQALSGSLKNPAKTTVDERTSLRDAVNALVGKRGLSYSEAYQMVHQRFGVGHIDELPRTKIKQAVEYVHRITLDGEVLDKEPLLTESEFKALMHMFAKLCTYTLTLRDLQKNLMLKPEKLSYWFSGLTNAPEEGFLFFFNPNIHRDLDDAANIIRRHKHLIA